MTAPTIRIQASIHDRIDDELREALRAKAAALPPLDLSFLLPRLEPSVDSAVEARLARIEACLQTLLLRLPAGPRQ